MTLYLQLEKRKKQFRNFMASSSLPQHYLSNGSFSTIGWIKIKETWGFWSDSFSEFHLRTARKISCLQFSLFDLMWNGFMTLYLQLEQFMAFYLY